jgi:hypothetical protein
VRQTVAGIVVATTGLAGLAILASSLALTAAFAQPAPEAVRFQAIDVYVESAEPLAAWQFELTETTGAMTVVGVENGDSAAYRDAPYFDLDAVREDRADRIVVADFSLAGVGELPVGRTRIATVHVRLSGGQAPDFNLQLIAAGDIDGHAIPAVADLEFDNGRTQ